MLTRIVVPLLCCSMSGAGHAQSAQATLNRAMSAYRGAETIRASFQQTITNPLTGTTSTTQGELFRRDPNLLAVIFAAPLTDRIVSDGSVVWLYLPSSAPGQVIKVAANKAGDMVLDPLGQVLAAPSDRYIVSDAGRATINGHATHAVNLSPKRESSPFTKATVWIDDSTSTVCQIETTESSGLIRRIVIKKVTTNSPIARSTFTFTPPANTRIVNGTP